MKIIENQGEKQIKVIQDQGQVKTIKKYAYDNKDTPLISKLKEIFNELVYERLEKIANLDGKVNSDNLIYRYKGNTADEDFNKFDNALDIINKIKNGEISLADVKNNQANFKSNLGEIKKGNNKKDRKSKKKKCFAQYWNALQSKKRGY